MINSMISVKFKKTTKKRSVVTIRILTDGKIKWRTVSGESCADRREMFNRAIAVGRRHCDGPVAYQLPLFL